MIRFCDIILSFLGLLILSPVLFIVYCLIYIESKGGGFYSQKRVGKDDKDFRLWKFRSMRIGSDKKGLITVGERDSRVTRVGYFIRRYKIDELPQLWNVLRGDMSLVGPRPEMRKYVDQYTQEQTKVLSVRPGITDWASIYYIGENSILGKSTDPDKDYVEKIVPDKIRWNMIWIEKQSLGEYFKIILKTIFSI